MNVEPLLRSVMRPVIKFGENSSEAWRCMATSKKNIIDKYGRFPHNNEALGRKNTPEEDEYMRLRNKK